MFQKRWQVIDGTKVRPLHGFVMLKFHNVPHVIDLGNGVSMPGIVAESMHWRVAEVVAVDPKGFMTRKRNRRPHEVKPGDLVLIDRIFGDVVIDNKVEALKYRVVSEDQIAGIIEGVTQENWWASIR